MSANKFGSACSTSRAVRRSPSNPRRPCLPRHIEAITSASNWNCTRRQRAQRVQLRHCRRWREGVATTLVRRSALPHHRHEPIVCCYPTNNLCKDKLQPYTILTFRTACNKSIWQEKSLLTEPLPNPHNTSLGLRQTPTPRRTIGPGPLLVRGSG